MASKWTNDEKEKLILSVSTFPSLFNKADINYRSRSVTDAAWTRVASHLDGHGLCNHHNSMHFSICHMGHSMSNQPKLFRFQIFMKLAWTLRIADFGGLFNAESCIPH